MYLKIFILGLMLLAVPDPLVAQEQGKKQGSTKGSLLTEDAASVGTFGEPLSWSERPLVIAHRGDSGHRPEHTLGAYRRAIALGADYIEPDLVMTKDGHLVARHDVYLSSTTNVAYLKEYADRKRLFEGREDWFVFDFTLAEIQTLRAVQPRQNRSKDWDGYETVPTFAEIVDMVTAEKKMGRLVGLYPEIKHPSAFTKMGLNPTAPFLIQLTRLERAGVPIFVQSFDADFLKQLSKKYRARFIYLVAADDKGKGPQLDMTDINKWAYGIGLDKSLFSQGGKLSPYAQKIRANSLKIHIWTLRDDAVRRGFASVDEELRLYYELGVDGLFADFPDTAVRVRDERRLLRPPEEID